MARIEKTVFISYRRVNRWVALAVFKDLTQHGYDVFVDYDGIASGDFERAIIDNIWARAHFVLLLTPVALENILKAKLKSNYKDENLDVTVAVASAPKDIPEEDLKPKIFVTGEVIRPGSYVVRQPTTLMQAIALSGGIGPFAAKNRIQVRRRGPGGDETIFMFNYKAYEAGADLEGNIRLRAGDVILVPERGLFD